MVNDVSSPNLAKRQRSKLHTSFLLRCTELNRVNFGDIWTFFGAPRLKLGDRRSLGQITGSTQRESVI